MKQEGFTAIDGYDKSKTPKTLQVRRFTLEDIRAMQAGTTTHYKMLDSQGKVRGVRANGKLRTRKRDTSRFERSFKYGLYEHFKLDTQGMLNTLVVVVGE
jgi:hypothetical protein